MGAHKIKSVVVICMNLWLWFHLTQLVLNTNEKSIHNLKLENVVIV